MNAQIKKAFKFGSVGLFTYFSSYIFRNLLGVFTPIMIENGAVNEQSAAAMSSTYMIVYACGQLFCGTLGDKIRSKYMVLVGLSVSGLGLLTFPFFHSTMPKILSFAALGLGLSALRGPIVKTISENLELKYARICSVLLSFVSFVGPLVAGFFAIILKWKTAFIVSACLALFFAFIYFLSMSAFEKKGEVKYIKNELKDGKGGGIKAIFALKSIIAYSIISMIVEIAASSISFWTPLFFTQHLGFSSDTAALLYSLISFLKALCPFAALFILSLFHDNDMSMAMVAFVISGVCFVLLSKFQSQMVCIVLFCLALICSSLVSALVWSVYIPSLARSGKISSVNGFLDCSGYFAAAASNMLFASIMKTFGWHGIIISWSIILFFGAGVAVVEKIFRKAQST